VELDGFAGNDNVVVFAATNRRDVLDPALTRPGRFDRNIEVTTPDISARIAIFKVHLERITLDLQARTFEDYAKRLASLTPGFTGADIANICNEAAILAARECRDTVGPKNFEMAAERIMAGLERKTLINDSEKKIVAVHESGHAVASWWLKSGLPLLKVTIIPRTKGSLGYAQYLPKENGLQSTEELLEEIIILLGGRCAEEHVFHEVKSLFFPPINF
jgi:AFG3 family protein